MVVSSLCLLSVFSPRFQFHAGIVQTQNQSFDFNGESDLDLEYAMGLTNPQTITLLQTGDIPEGASFDNWLDAVDKSFCTFEGGDDPTQVWFSSCYFVITVVVSSNDFE